LRQVGSRGSNVELIGFSEFETIEIYGIVPEAIMQMERSGELAKVGLIIY